MIEKKILVLTEGGCKCGFGHITRCVSIGSAFRSKGFEVDFLIDGDKSIENIVENFKYRVFDWKSNFEKTSYLIKRSSIILLDSIQVSNEYVRKISSLRVPIIHIDDDKQSNVINNGFIVDWTVLREGGFKKSDRREKVTYLLGSKYTPLRSDFYNVKKYIIRENIGQIMITFGGSDFRKITLKVLKFFTKFYPEIRKKIVIGGGLNSDYIFSIKNHLDKNSDLIINASTKVMIETMYSSDVAIASGGQTLYELAKVGTPTIAIIVVDNALHDTLGWEKAGFLKNVGWYFDSNLTSNIQEEIEIMKNLLERERMSNSGLRLMSGNGANLIVDNVIEKVYDTV